MSQIFAPGAIAGPPATFLGAYNAGTTYAMGQAVSSGGSSYVSLVNGNAGNAPASSPSQWALLAASGTAGAAGSAAAVSALAGAVMPSFVGRNLFNAATILSGVYYDPTTGALTADGSQTSSALIYCPGATSMISTIPIDYSGSAICLFDANGTFVSSIAQSALGGAYEAGPASVGGGIAVALPGTQVYIAVSWKGRWGGGYGWASGPSAAMLYASIGVSATLPGSYSPAGLDTIADVNAKDAVVAANAATALAAALTTNNSNFAQAVLPSPFGGTRNAFDFTKITASKVVNTDGTVTSGSWSVATVYAPGATSFISNIPIRGVPNSVGVCLYDALGNFIQDISTTTLASSFTEGNCLVQNTVYALPGTQTYIKFNYSDSNWGGYGYPNSKLSGVFYAGNTASPNPTSLTAANSAIPFTGNAPYNCKTASRLGAAIDGSYDATAVLNAFLATASSSNPVELVLDGMVQTTGLIISPNGYTSIRGLGAGTGINVISGTPQDGIRIGAYTSGTGNSEGAYNISAPSRSAVNIMLRDFTINAGGQVNAGANQPVSGAAAHGTYPIILANCSNVAIDNLTFPEAGANYCITLTNADHVRIANCVFTTGGYTHDGIHIDGPSEDIGIENCDFATGDDAIALNAPEGFGGDISRVTVTNCRFHSALTVMRIYTSLDAAAMPSNNVHRVKNVTVSNCGGSVTSVCFNLGITNGGLSSTSDAGQIQDLTVSGCSLIAPQGLALILDTIGSLTFRGVRFIPSGASSLINGNFAGVGELVLDDVCVLRNGDGNSALDAFVNLAFGASMGRVTLSHCRALDQQGSSYSAHTSLIDNGGTITTLRLEAIDMTNIAALFGGSGGVGTLTALIGSGVIGTGVQIADSVMGNGALYLSSNASGAVSMKVGATAKRLTLT